MEILKLNSVAVLIDCWDMHGFVADNNVPAFDDVYTNIIEFLDQTPEIKIVVLASYDTEDFSGTNDTAWYNSTDKLHKTADKILNYINKEKKQISLTLFEDFANLLGKNPDIKNIYFMGTSWDDCIQHRNISIQSCSNIGKNILVNTKCVFHTIDSTLNLKYNSRFIHRIGDIYQLKNKEIM
jgi:hypothetical protein